MRCPGSNTNVAGARYYRRHVACRYCLTWFPNDELLHINKDGHYVALGIFPAHARPSVSRKGRGNRNTKARKP